jgi:FkbM family methyltransferase
MKMKKIVLKIAALFGFKDSLVEFVINNRSKKLYRQFINKDDLVFDVGANIGNRAKFFNDLGARVVCVEPQEKCVAILKEKFKNNPAITIVPKGLSDKVGTITLYTSDESSVIATMSEKWKDEGRFAGNTNWNNSKIVELSTLDILISEFGLPKFCKIDVEGFEKNVLSGLSNKIPFISFEFTMEFLNDAIDCLTILQKNGAIKVNYSVGETMLFANPDFMPMEDCIAQIKASNDNLLWGDIYVKYTV